MKFIQSFEELKALSNGTEVNNIVRGDILTYIIVGSISKSTGLVVLNNDNLSKAIVLYEKDFSRGKWTADYSSTEIGKLMIEQLEEYAAKETRNIRAVYLGQREE